MSTASPEQQRLRRLEDLIEQWKSTLIADVAQARSEGEIDSVYMGRFKDTVLRLTRLNDELHPEDFDPEALAEIRDILLKGIAAAETFDESRPLDAVDDFLVRAEALRHLIRDALDGHVGGAADDAQAVTRALREWLPGIKQKDLAELIGRSPRHVQRWLKDGGEPTRRLQLVARLVAILRLGWTSEGVLAWFYRPRRELKGKRPVDVLDDAEYERPLLVSARQGRAQHGA